MALGSRASTTSNSAVESSADLHRKAFQPGADPMVNMTCQNPAWDALHGLLPTHPPTTGSANSAAGPNTGMVLHGGKLRPSPKDSPLSVSSLGSPNSSRDFDTDTPLITGQDDFHLGSDQINHAGYAPLFNIQPQAGDATGWDTMYLPYGPSAQQTFNAEQAPFPNSYIYTTRFGTSMPTNLSSGNNAPTDIDPSVLNGTFSPSQQYGQHTFAGAQGHADISSAITRLSLSESVSGYSSGADAENSMSSSLAGLSSNPSGAPTPSASSGEASPVACSAPSQQTVAQVMGGMVRERVATEAGRGFFTHRPNPASQGRSGNADAKFHDMSMPLFAQQQGRQISGTANASQSLSASVAARHQAQPVSQQKSTKARSGAHRSAKKVALGQRSDYTERKAALGLGQRSEYTEFMRDGKRWFRCRSCEKEFDRAFNLKAHLDVHSPFRVYPYACPFEACRKRFSRKADCRRHTRSVHYKGKKPEAGAPLFIVLDRG